MRETNMNPAHWSNFQMIAIRSNHHNMRQDLKVP